MIAIIEKFKKEYWNIYARLLDLEDVNFDLLNQEVNSFTPFALIARIYEVERLNNGIMFAGRVGSRV